MKKMKWRNALGINKDGAEWLIPDGIDSDAGYRVIRQAVFREGYRYSAWQPAPELKYPKLKLLGIFDSSESAKAACNKHFNEGESNG